MEMLEEEEKERDRRKQSCCTSARKTNELKDGMLKSVKPCRKMDELKEDERTHQRDAWIENRNQHGFQSKPIPVRSPPPWEVTDRKDTWSDDLLEAIRAYFGVMEMLEMTKAQSEDKFERQTTWASVAIDFERATATKIPTATATGPRSKARRSADTQGKS